MKRCGYAQSARDAKVSGGAGALAKINSRSKEQNLGTGFPNPRSQTPGYTAPSFSAYELNTFT